MNQTTAISCDLDDTLAPDQKHYDKAKDELAELIQDYGCSKSKKEIIEYLDDIDADNYEEMGVTKTRFAQSCHQTAIELVGTQAGQEAWNIGRSVFMNPEEYGEIGTFEGYAEFIEAIQANADHSLVLTAGVKDIQKDKVNGLELHNDFDEIKIVPSGGKQNVLEQLDSKYDQVIHIGNSARSDIEPALDAGVSAIHINTNDWLADQEQEFDTIWSTDCLYECAKMLHTQEKI